MQPLHAQGAAAAKMDRGYVHDTGSAGGANIYITLIGVVMYVMPTRRVLQNPRMRFCVRQ